VKIPNVEVILLRKTGLELQRPGGRATLDAIQCASLADELVRESVCSELRRQSRPNGPHKRAGRGEVSPRAALSPGHLTETQPGRHRDNAVA
jgi:hypothetical protein